MYVGSVSTSLSASVNILGVQLSLDTVRTILARALNMPFLDCTYLRNPANEVRIRRAIEGLVLDTIRPLIGAKDCDVEAIDIVVEFAKGAITSSGVPVDAAVALLVDRALCEVIRGAMSLISFGDKFVRPIYAALVDTCKAAAAQGGASSVVVDDRYGVTPPAPSVPPASSSASTSTQPASSAPASSGKPSEFLLRLLSNEQQAEIEAKWAPAKIETPKKSALPFVLAGGVALAVSVVILSRRR
jgi:hypothetical protein